MPYIIHSEQVEGWSSWYGSRSGLETLQGFKLCMREITAGVQTWSRISLFFFFFKSSEVHFMIEGRGEEDIDSLGPIGMGVAITVVECIAANREG